MPESRGSGRTLQDLPSRSKFTRRRERREEPVDLEQEEDGEDEDDMTDERSSSRIPNSSISRRSSSRSNPRMPGRFARSPSPDDRAVANLNLQAFVPYDRIATLGHVLDGGAIPMPGGIRMPGAPPHGPPHGKYPPCHGGGYKCRPPRCNDHCENDNDDDGWWEKFKKYWLPWLFIIIILMAVAYALGLRTSLFNQGRKKLAVSKTPLLTIQPPSSLSNNAAKQLKKISWNTLHEENEIFGKLATDTSTSNLASPDRERLYEILNYQHKISQKTLDRYTAVYNEYVKFIHITTNELIQQYETLDAEIENPVELIDISEKGIWPLKKTVIEANYATTRANDYEEYWDHKESVKDALKPQLHDLYNHFYLSNCTILSSTLNNLIAQFSSPEASSKITKWSQEKNRILLEDCQIKIRKPCQTEIEMKALMQKYEKDIDKTVDEAVFQSYSEKSFKDVLPWKYSLGRNERAKKQTWSVGVLRVVNLSVQRAIGLFSMISGEASKVE